VHFGRLRHFVLLVYSLSLKNPFPKHKPSAVRGPLGASVTMREPQMFKYRLISIDIMNLNILFLNSPIRLDIYKSKFQLNEFNIQ
jgi:hypothetical protein